MSIKRDDFSFQEPKVGIEPTTRALRKRCSTTEPLRLGADILYRPKPFYQELPAYAMCFRKPLI